MRFIIRLVVITAVLGLSMMVKAQEAPVVAVVGETLNGSEVSIHSGPGPDYTEIAVSSKGMKLVVTGRNDFDPATACSGIYRQDIGLYLRVQFSEFEGWIWRCHPYLTLSGDISTLPVVEPAHAVYIRDAGYPIQKLSGSTLRPAGISLGGFVTYNAALLREEPDVTGAIIGSVVTGGYVYATGRTERAGWVKVVVSGQTGWMAAHLLHLQSGWQEIVPVVQASG